MQSRALWIGLVVVLFALTQVPTPRASAQDPFPDSFMRNAAPGSSPPNDGGSVLVVEGQGAGIGGCPYDLNTIAYITISNINAGRPTVTEISVQGPGNCPGTVQDWKNVVLELVTNVENSAPNAGTWWGGVMLDEESETGFGWSSPSEAAAWYEDLNAAVQTLMDNTRGISRYYTESFTGIGDWDIDTFQSVTRSSIAAPQIANSNMVSLTNQLRQRTGVPVLVT